MSSSVDTEERRQLAADIFNHVWTLLERDDRTKEDDEEMIHAAHASRFFWGEVGGPEHRARGEWQCSRVYAVLERGEPAVHHATRCLEICQEHGIGDWDIAFAYEALARAHRVAGNREEAERFKVLARASGNAIADPEDRDVFERDYATL